MARKRRPTPTRAIIVKSASDLFFEKGFSRTTSLEVCRLADISTGNLTFYFPTKEHILAVIVKMMIDFQWDVMEEATDDGKSSLLAYCLELTTLAAIADESAEMRDFFIAAYTHPMTIDLIRENDLEKVRKVFGEFTHNWSVERFIEAEAIISGIEFATIMKTEHSASVEFRIAGALNAIMLLFGVPEEIRRMKITKVLTMDYRAIGRNVLDRFREYVNELNEHAIEEVMAYRSEKPTDIKDESKPT